MIKRVVDQWHVGTDPDNSFCWHLDGQWFGSGFVSRSGSISQRHWSADPDPDLHQNVHGSATLPKTYVSYGAGSVSATLKKVLLEERKKNICTPHPFSFFFLLISAKFSYHINIPSMKSCMRSGASDFAAWNDTSSFKMHLPRKEKFSISSPFSTAEEILSYVSSSQSLCLRKPSHSQSSL